MSHARKLAAWVGEGKPVTAKGVLRKMDVARVAAALGVDVPEKVRSAADVAAIHRPWVAAEATGMIKVGVDKAVAAGVVDGEPEELWLTGIEGVLRVESHDRRQKGAAVLCRAVLVALDTDTPPALDDLRHIVYQLPDFYDSEDYAAMSHAFRGFLGVEDAVELLTEFGAVDRTGQLTVLGRWARDRFEERVPQPVTPDLSAGDLLTRLAAFGGDEVWGQAVWWLRSRRLVDGAAQILHAADHASPLQRLIAVFVVSGLGDDALPAWRSALRYENVKVHAEAELADYGEGSGPDAAGKRWLVAEHAVAGCARDDVAGAYHYVLENGGLDEAARSGHPDAAALHETLSRFAASDEAKVHIYQLKIALTRMKPQVWRRVLVPSSLTLGRLHHVIGIAMDWGDDHLHAFDADGVRYSDPYYGLEEHLDENDVRLFAVLPRPGTSIKYVYDFGASWEHQITCEKFLDPEGTVTYPVCTAGRGDAPVEDFNEEFPEKPTPFDKDELNRRLAKLSIPQPPV